MRSAPTVRRGALALALLGAILAILPMTASALSGSKPWVVVLCKFTDRTNEPQNVAYYERMFAGTGTSNLDFVDYWGDVSYNQLSVSGTVVKGWNTMPMTRYQWAGLSRYNKIRTCADTAAGSVNYANYYGVVAIFNDDSAPQVASTTLSAAVNNSATSITVASSAGFPTAPFAVSIDDGTDTSGDGNSDNGEKLNVTAVSGTTWTIVRNYESPGGTAKAHNNGAAISLIDGGDLGAVSTAAGPVAITLGGSNFNLGLVVGPWNYNLTGVAHETGHAFGYDHSRKLSTSTTDYADCYDDMSAYQTCSFVGDFGQSNLGSVNAAAGPGLTGILLDEQGWMPAPRVYMLDNSACNQTSLTMAGLNYSAVSGYLVAKIPAALTIPTPGSTTTTSQHYWLEYRDRTGWDAGLPRSAVVLHLRGADGFAYWVDSAAGDGDLTAGEEFVNAGVNTYVAVNSIDTTAHNAVVTIAGCKLGATLTWAGDTAGDYSDAATLAADLKVGAAPVPGKTLTLGVGSQTCSATTNASGRATCTVVLSQTPGGYTASASFAGSGAYNSASASTPFTIDREDTALSYTGATTADYHDPATAAGRLSDADSAAGVSGRSIAFLLGVSDNCSAITDGGGNASCTIVPNQVPAIYTIGASFAGDSFYKPSSAAVPFLVTKEQTTTTYTGPTVIAQGEPLTLSGTLVEDDGTPVPGRMLTLSVGGNSCTGTTTAAGIATCTVAAISAPLGPQPLVASFAGDAYYLASADATKQAIVFAFLPRGSFVLGDTTVAAAGPAPSATVTWWGSKWATLNDLSGGSAPESFKGFAASFSSRPPRCGGTWTAPPGNSAPPAASVPSYMGVVAASSVGKSGATISGNVTRIVVVSTMPGYAPNPGGAGTGTIVATYC